MVSLSADKTETKAEEDIELSVVVKNIGNSTLKAGVPVSIAFSGSKGSVRLYTSQSIEVGDSAVLRHSYVLPPLVGPHAFAATVNPDKKIEELLYVNYRSNDVALSIISPFSATAQTDKDIYCRGEQVVVSGVAASDVDVEVYLINEETRQTIDAHTDGHGKYSVVFTTFNTQSGHFSVGACYPGSQADEDMDSFDIYGLKTSDRFKTQEFCRYETASGKITVLNPGIFAQTGLSVRPKLIPDNCEFHCSMPASG